jgi:hypothetical protein
LFLMWPAEPKELPTPALIGVYSDSLHSVGTAVRGSVVKVVVGKEWSVVDQDKLISMFTSIFMPTVSKS